MTYSLILELQSTISITVLVSIGLVFYFHILPLNITFQLNLSFISSSYVTLQCIHTILVRNYRYSYITNFSLVSILHTHYLLPAVFYNSSHNFTNSFKLLIKEHPIEFTQSQPIVLNKRVYVVDIETKTFKKK